MCVAWTPSAPDPTVAACRSGIAVVTCTPLGSPRSAATSSSTGPITEPVGTSGGSFAASILAMRTSAGSYAGVRSRRRLSISHAASIDAGDAAARPVKRIAR